MTERKNDGGQAFPSAVNPASGGAGGGGGAWPPAPTTNYGMSLRDWFAGQAIGPYMSWSLSEPQEPGDTRHSAAARYAHVAYEIADAMLAERDRA